MIWGAMNTSGESHGNGEGFLRGRGAISLNGVPRTIGLLDPNPADIVWEVQYQL